MRLITTKDGPELAELGADLLAARISANPTLNVVPATGRTPQGIYERLAHRVRKNELDASRLRVFQLDEYLGLGPDDPRLLRDWMLRSFVRPLGIPKDNVICLLGDAAEPDAACRAYDRAVTEAGGYDLAVLGLGPNGHLAFNEPPADPTSNSRAVTLTEESILSNGVYWGGRNRVPRRALTAGMAPILAARNIVLVVSGAHKREVAHRTLHGPITPALPASFLQTSPNVTVLIDEPALGR